MSVSWPGSPDGTWTTGDVYRTPPLMALSSLPYSLVETVQALRAGNLDLATYLAALCDRIDAVEPRIQALLPEPGRRERLHAESHVLQNRYPEAASRPSMFGVPVGVKDIFRVEGFPTRCGSALPADLFEGPEAETVSRLKAAGALILGKTVTTEFAYFEPGPTRNPRNPQHTPGGSSSGSAAAVAARYCPLALGSQTVGSVIRPAAFCGVVGIKPSSGLLSLQGIIPYSPSIDHPGFFVPKAADLDLAMQVLAPGYAPRMPASGVLGVPEGPYLRQATTEVLVAFEKQVAHLRARGWEVRRVTAMEDIEAINHRHNRLAAAELAEVHAGWFARYAEQYRPRTAAWIREGQNIPDDEVREARQGRERLRTELTDLMDRHAIDAWISPAATGPAPAGIESTGSPAMNLPWTHAGMPVVSLPAGCASNGLPLGLQVVGRFGEDARLTAQAVLLEEALGE